MDGFTADWRDWEHCFPGDVVHCRLSYKFCLFIKWYLWICKVSCIFVFFCYVLNRNTKENNSVDLPWKLLLSCLEEQVSLTSSFFFSILFIYYTFSSNRKVPVGLRIELKYIQISHDLYILYVYFHFSLFQKWFY